MKTRASFLFVTLSGVCALTPAAASFTLSQVPLYLTTSAKPNVLVILDNSNSMDEAPNGSAVGSNHPDSKSEIARGVIRDLLDSYLNDINLGLMAYRINTPSDYHLHNALYDVSYNPANYNPAYDLTPPGARDSATKKYRTPNPSDPGHHIYYNVALPFYSSANRDRAFCYSRTADFDNGNELYPTGPWDRYRCYRIKTGTSDALPASDIPEDALAQGYNNYFATYALTPTDSDLAQGILDFGRFLAWSHVGRTWYRNDSPGRGFLHAPIRALDTSHANTIRAALACNIPPASSPPAPCTSAGIRNAGLTPIEGTLRTARDYFAGTWSTAAEGYSASVYPLPNSCGKNFVVLLTDGLPNVRDNGTVYTNPATALAGSAAAAGELRTRGIETYVVGFALPAGVNPATLNTLAEAGGTGSAYNANDAASLRQAFDTIIDDIERRSSSASNLANNTTRLTTESMIYQARFSSLDWSGELLAYPLLPDGSRGALRWNAADHIPAPNARRIFTWNGTTGTPFTWAGLSAGQRTSLGSEAVLAYLRGDTSGEVRNGGSFRNRSRVLGDIVNSDPVYVGRQNFGYVSLGASEAASYDSFRAGKAARRSMIYVGANDGMLHGFDSETGEERLAYVPAAILGQLPLLTAPTYSHRYFVDGSPWAADAYFAPRGTGTAAWRTVLLGTLGAGGRAVFALDVSDPDAFDASKVLWEFTHPELGYTLPQASIARLNNGRWAAVFGNGYLSDSGRARLFIVYLDADASNGWDEGSDYLILDTDTSTHNGLSTTTLYDHNGDGIVDYVYAGDMNGNVWKFNLTAGHSSAWQVAYQSGGAKLPLFTARNANNQVQPITGQVEIGPAPPGKSGVMLFFGTGRYFATGDNSDKTVQSFYALWDAFTGDAATDRITYTCTGSACDRGSVLVQQTITHETTHSGGSDVRVTSNASVDYASKRGWYLDLKYPNTAAGEKGERVVSMPLLRHGRVIFTTLLPSNDPCSFGGTSWLMELQAHSGARPAESVLDLNHDRSFGSADMVTVMIGGSSVTVPVSGARSTAGIIKMPTVINDQRLEHKLASGTSGDIYAIRESGGGYVLGRVSWQELFEE